MKFIGLCILIILSACGTNSGVSSSQPLAITGIFIDSPVANLAYSTEGAMGMTDARGQYTCNLGADVTFYLDDGSNRTLRIGKIPCRPVVSPIELLTNDSFNLTSDLNLLPLDQQISVTRFLRLIQSLDVDSNPDNGISLNQSNLVLMMDYLENADRNSEEVRHNFKDALTYLLNPSFFNDAEFDTELSALMSYMARSGDEVSAIDALAHFNNFRASCTPEGCDDGVSNYAGLNSTLPEHLCLIGTSLASPEEMRASVVDSRNGQYHVFPLTQEVYQDLALTTTIIILYPLDSRLALVLRSKEPGDIDYFTNRSLENYYQWDASWSHDEDKGILNINNIPFLNFNETWQFVGMSSLNDSYPSLMQTSAGLEVPPEDLMWYSEANCPLPESNF